MNERVPGMGDRLMLQEVQEVKQIATLPFGLGLVGADRHLEGTEKVAYQQALARHQHAIPEGLWLPNDCMDERDIIALADGTQDSAVLLRRRAGQLAGGTVLATTKAAVAANAAFLRGVKTFKQAYETTYDVLDALGIPDAAHEDCGASKFVKKSIAERLGVDTVMTTFRSLGTPEEVVRNPLATLELNKSRRLEEGLYEDWDPLWHADFVSSRQPHNFSRLKTAPDAVHGHHASSLLLVKDGHYFAKNAFIAETGRQSFALTLGEGDRIADAIGGSAEEKALLKLAFRDDSFNVANHIVAPGMEVNS